MGNWIIIPENNNISNIKILLKNKSKNHAANPADTRKDQIWTKPGSLLDSDNPDIKKIAEGLIQQYNTNDSIASAIQKYVRDNIRYRESHKCFSQKASETLKLKWGICVNRSRLFAAICRASGVPARTVWGYFYVPPAADHEGHHE
jgi:transglutaminase-like putative cysteine protease